MSVQKKIAKKIENKNTLKTTTKMTSTSTVITAKFIKTADYDSCLFKVVEQKEEHETLGNYIKEFNGDNFIYLKNKYLDANKKGLDLLCYYKMKLSFDTFTNKEDKEITYISQIRYRVLPDYKEPVNELSSDDEF